ncbi:MAG: crosslink repair DNA glycosylase YcaQ family protein, partial [Antricoccus sp.]
KYIGADRDAADKQTQDAGLDSSGVRNFRQYLDAQREATGAVPNDRQILFERFRDELGDWRIVVHSPFGDQVNAPWSLLIAARLQERYGVDAQAMHADDGIVLRIPDTTDDPPTSEIVSFEPDEIADAVTAQISNSALFASRFRECAARALLLPRRDPSKRSPLWQQRQRASQLLTVAARYRDFPMILETVRECLQDVYDVPGLIAIMSEIRSRRIAITEVDTPRASPFAQSLLFGYLAAFMYQDDLPLAERRASALALDLGLLRELLGHTELRELLDADSIDDVERRLQRLDPQRPLRDAEDLADTLRLLGDLSAADITVRGGRAEWTAALELARRILPIRMAGQSRWISVEDAGRYQDALGVALPVGVAEVFTAPVEAPLHELIARYGRTHGPFTVSDVASRLGIGVAVVRGVLDQLAASGRLSAGEFRPGRTGEEWCDIEVLRLIRRRSLAAVRAEVEPVPQSRFAQFLTDWHRIGPQPSMRGVDRLYEVIDQLAGAPLVASALESLILPSRITDYKPAMLDELTSQGDVLWTGVASLAGNDGIIRLSTAGAPELLGVSMAPTAELPAAVLDVLEPGNAMFYQPLRAALSDRLDRDIGDRELLELIWSMTFDGILTNDTIAALRNRLHAPRAGRNGATRPTRTANPRTARGRVARSIRPSQATTSGPPTAIGRWSRVTGADPTDPTTSSQQLVDSLLERYGVLTRGSVQAEGVVGGFGGIYPILAEYEDSGRARRGYFIERLGAAQFASPGAVDRLREGGSSPDLDGLVLAATDPAQPYGAALSWPDRTDRQQESKHRPARKAGALVVLVVGEPAIYVESGGRTLLSFTDDPDRLRAAAQALARAVTHGALGRLTVERTDGRTVHGGGPLPDALAAAGFVVTPRGLRLRS